LLIYCKNFVQSTNKSTFRKNLFQLN